MSQTFSRLISSQYDISYQHKFAKNIFFTFVRKVYYTELGTVTFESVKYLKHSR